MTGCSRPSRLSPHRRSFPQTFTRAITDWPTGFLSIFPLFPANGMRSGALCWRISARFRNLDSSRQLDINHPFLCSRMAVSEGRSTMFEENPQFVAARQRMVDEQLIERGIRDSRVLDAMRRIPRHAFIPPEYHDLAYADGPLPIGN